MISSYTLVALAGLSLVVAKDQEVGELGFGIRDITEGCGDVVAPAQCFPLLKEGVLDTLVLGSGAGGCELERSAEISLKAMCVGR